MEELLKDIPPRSYLYSIPTLGNGTSHIESLTSYVTRLVNAHNLTSGVFFSKIIYPKLAKKNIPNYGFVPRKSGSFNNIHQNAKELVKALTMLTGIKDLENHTLLKYRSFISFVELRFVKYWCPYCFQEFKENNLPVYEKLIWAFEIVEVCLEHNCRLICECPTCKTEQLHLTRSGVMGYCFKCGSWLGGAINECDTQYSDEYFSWQTWLVKNVIDILNLTKFEIEKIEASWKIYNTNIKSFIKSVCDKYQIGKVKFLGIIKIQSTTFYLWEKGEGRASLQSLLKLCYVTNISLKDLLLMNFIIDEELRQLPDFIFNNQIFRSQKKYDIEYLRKFLLEIINDKKNEPPPLTRVAKSLGFRDSHTLRIKLPDETAIIVKNHRDYVNEEKEKRIIEIRDIILKLINNGIYPSQKNIEDELGKPSYFWCNSNRKLLNNLCKQLGVERKKGRVTSL